MKTIVFDENSVCWRPNMVENNFFLLRQVDYLRERLIAVGYLYLNTIYENFGVMWDPDLENVCYRSKNGLLSIDFKQGQGNTFFITIDQ